VIKVVKKKDSKTTLELEILQHIKKNPYKPNRLSNLFDYWEQTFDPGVSRNTHIQQIDDQGFSCFAMEKLGMSLWSLL